MHKFITYPKVYYVKHSRNGYGFQIFRRTIISSKCPRAMNETLFFKKKKDNKNDGKTRSRSSLTAGT